MPRSVVPAITAALGITAVALALTVAVGPAAATPLATPLTGGRPSPRTSAHLLIATTPSHLVTTVAATPAALPPTAAAAPSPHPATPPPAADVAVSAAPQALTLYAQGAGVTTPATPTPTFTTIPSIRNRLPVPPSTVPLQTRAMSTHISPVFPALSGAGFFVALVLVTTRLVMTRARRKG